MARRKVSNLALFVDMRRKAAVQAAKKVALIASQHGVTLQAGTEQAKSLGFNDAAAAAAFPDAADLMVSLGGDGTLLRAAHLAGPLGIPIIGVDFGRVGFLTEVAATGYEAVIADLLRDGIEPESHIALSARLGGSGRSFYAVNDVHIDRKHHGHIVNFGIHLSGEAIANIPADGIIVASPTGSTAYLLSAGGPIMSPKLQAIGIAPICPHTLFSRPLIVSADETIEITVPKESSGTQLFVDGQPEVELEPGATITVTRAARPVEFVRLDRRYFFHTLERKLHWGMPIKRVLDEEREA